MGDLVVITRNGIWWMSDCYDEVPWPTDLDTDSSVSESYGPCDPLGSEYVMKFYFTRVGFATDTATVTSLSSKDDRLIITCEGTTTEASTGPLEIDLDLSFIIGQQNLTGYLAFKTFNSVTNTFNLGPVAEGVYATTTNVLLASPFTTTDTLGRTIYHGPIGIGVLSQSTQQLSSQLVRLDGVTEENYPVLYLGMPDDVTTNYVVKFEVPFTAPVSSSFSFIARILGRAAGTLPQLTCTYYKATRPPDGLLVPVAVTQSYVALTIPTIATISANQAVEAASSAIAVAPGDIVYIRVQRTPAAVGDTYAGELGVMQQVGLLTSS
jgi:hypothetical protein